MFEGAERKLSLAEYFLNKLKLLANEAGGFAHIERDRQQEMRATLDGFFFELVSAKDFFLQGVNDRFAGLPRDEATQISKLKRCLSSQGAMVGVEVVKKLEKELSNPSSWLWEINHYRNSATHRELIHFGFEAKAEITVDKDEFKKIQKLALEGKLKVELITERNKSKLENSATAKRIDGVPVKTYLFKDPEDPSQGNAAVEVIPYCGQSLDNMGKLLNHLYAELQF